MNNISIIEIILLGVVVLIQTKIALKVNSQIKRLAKIIPPLTFFKLEKFNILTEVLQTVNPKEILKNPRAYERHSTVGEVQEDEQESQSEVSLIIFNKERNKERNEIFNDILSALNVYFLRNKGAAADFSLMKDVVERNLDMEEEGITHTVTAPLYLGLIGTMIGIVAGLANLFMASQTNADFEITGFLIGVAIAMGASLYGLAWTVYNSSFNLKNARKKLEKAKNEFYTFLQTELLPVLNQSVSGSVYTLQANLKKFNDNFTVNLERLSSMLNKNYDALIAQEKILQALESINITEFAKANVKVLMELKSSIEHLAKFNQYLNNLNYLTEGTSRLTNAFENLLTRSNNFHGLAEKLDGRMDESNKLIQFLNDHFQQLEERGEIIGNAVEKVEDVMIKSLNQLKEHTQTKIEAIKQIAIKEEDLMARAFAANRSHISKLSLLEDLKSAIEGFRSNSKGSTEGIRQEVESLKVSLIDAFKQITVKSTSQIDSVKEEMRLVKRSIEQTNLLLEKISAPKAAPTKPFRKLLLGPSNGRYAKTVNDYRDWLSKTYKQWFTRKK